MRTSIRKQAINSAEQSSVITVKVMLGAAFAVGVGATMGSDMRPITLPRSPRVGRALASLNAVAGMKQLPEPSSVRHAPPSRTWWIFYRQGMTRGFPAWHDSSGRRSDDDRCLVASSSAGHGHSERSSQKPFHSGAGTRRANVRSRPCSKVVASLQTELATGPFRSCPSVDAFDTMQR